MNIYRYHNNDCPKYDINITTNLNCHIYPLFNMFEPFKLFVSCKRHALVS